MNDNRDRPRVLHLIDTGGPGGAETVFSSLAGFGHRNEFNAAVAVPYDGWLAEQLRNQGIRPIIIPSKGTNAAQLTYRLAALARESGANLVHAHLLGSSVYGALVGALQRVPVVAVFHGATDLKEVGTFIGAKRWLLNRPRVTPVAVSDAVIDSLAEWGLHRERIRLIRNGVDTERFSPVGTTSLHSEIGVADNVRIVGAVGNIRPAKAYEVFIEAALLISDDFPDVHFVVAGAGSENDLASLRSIVNEHYLTSRFHFLGFRASSKELYRSFSVLVSSSKTEGLPLSFLEAMACAVPIAATANAGSSQLLRETKAGLLSPVGDARALARSVATLLDDPTQAHSLGSNGRAAAVRHFSIEKTLAEYRKLYDELLAA